MNERTRLVLFIAISAAILFSWGPLMTYFGFVQPPATQPASQPAVASTTSPATSDPTTQPVINFTPGNATVTPPAIEPGPGIKALPTTGPTAPVTLGSTAPKDPTYALELSINPVGGGLEQVVLNNFKQRVDSDERFTFEKPYGPAGTSPLATRTITLNGQTIDISSQVWRVDRSDRSATLTLELADPSGQPIVRLEKTYEIFARQDEKAPGAEGYEIRFSRKATNLTGGALEVSATLVGPTFPASEMARGGDRQVIAGYRGSKAVALHYEQLENFTADAPTKDFTVDKNGQQLLWIGAGGNYFNAIIRPLDNWIAKAKAEALNPTADSHARQVLLTLDTVSSGQLAPGASSEVVAKTFFGPRLRSLLKNDYYAGSGIEYQHTLEISGSCAYCTFQTLVDWLMMLLGWMHGIFRDWGLAIIALVFIVRAILHPITKKSQVNMAKMAKMGPEIERIKKKYGDDKDAMNRAMMEFYKNHGATPILGCLPMFLQMPIWIALYSGLSTTFELRHEPFLYNLTWIKDLSKPDHLIELAPGSQFNFLFLHIDGLNVIPILLAVAFYLQFMLQPKPPAMTDEQKQQQKMMMWMTTLLFPIMLYPMPSGLNIYIFASTVFGVIESKIIRRHIDKQEALKPAGPNIVDGEVIDRAAKSQQPAEKKGGGFMGWFAQLQERAEQMRNDAEKKAQQKRNKK